MLPGRWWRSSSSATARRRTRTGPTSSTPSPAPDGGRLGEARAVLAVPRARRLLAAQALSQLADGLYQVALASVLIFDVAAAESPGQATKVIAVTLLPYSILSPFTGPFIDRFSRRSILVGSSLLRAVMTLALAAAATGGEGLLLGLTVAVISLNRFFHATRAAVLPSLVPNRHYLTANALATTVGAVFGAGGAVLGGWVAGAISPRAGLLAGGASMALAAVLASTIPLPRGERKGLAGIAAEIRENLRDVRAGLRAIRGSPSATYGLLAVWSIRAALGFVLVAALVLLRTRFDAGTGEFSVVIGFVGLGGLLGAVAAPAVARRVGQSRLPPIGFLLAGVATLALMPLVRWPAVLATAAVAGAVMYGIKIAGDTLIQQGLPDEVRGRAFAVYDIGYNGGAFLLATLTATLLLPVVGDLGIILVTGSLSLLAALIFARWRRSLAPSVHVHFYAGGSADETPRTIVLDGVPHQVAEVTRSSVEERTGVRVRSFDVRTASGAAFRITGEDEVWAARPVG